MPRNSYITALDFILIIFFFLLLSRNYPYLFLLYFMNIYMQIFILLSERIYYCRAYSDKVACYRLFIPNNGEATNPKPNIIPNFDNSYIIALDFILISSIKCTATRTILYLHLLDITILNHRMDNLECISFLF